MLSLLISPKQIYFHVLFHIARWPQQWQQVKQKKTLSQSAFNKCISSLGHRGLNPKPLAIEVFG